MIRLLTLSIFAFLIFQPDAIQQSWKTYPYHEANSELFFPDDEGWHPGEPIEWWYTNARVTGSLTGKEYSFMLTYFYFPVLGFDGFRILNLSNETDDIFYDETLPCFYSVLAEDHLEIEAVTPGGGPEKWTTLTDPLTGDLLPFQYHLQATGQNGAIDLQYNTLKRPLMVGGTGFLYQGFDNYTYYYSQTSVEVNGMLTFEGFSEPVSGIAWIDRQWGNFNPNTGEDYEWFSLQLSNGTDINLWNIFTIQNEIPDTSTYRYLSAYVNDTTAFTLSDFNLERLGYNWMPDNQVCYSSRWRLTADNPPMDLIINTLHDDHEVDLPFRFYEGTTHIEGSFDGQPVSGNGFAELLRHYQHPAITFLTPNDADPWDASVPVTWQLLDPDDGRPVLYDLEVSDDQKQTFTPIAQNLEVPEFLWDPAGFSPDSLYWFRLTGRSIDGTLKTTVETTTPQMIVSDAAEALPETMSVEVFPNPAGEAIFFHIKNPVKELLQINLFNIHGMKKKTAVYEHAHAPQALSLAGIPSGIYILEIQNGRSKWEKVVVLK